jgi:phenylacetate-CoA oxygenase PaaI subunit
MNKMQGREAAIEATGEASTDVVDLSEFRPEGRRAILALLITLGDNKYKLGRRYSEWSTSGPTLEASVAAASMTGDEMGHARSLYPLLRKFPDAPAELKREDDRKHFHNVSFLDTPFATWTDFVATAALFDRALSVLVEALRDSSYSPFRHRAAKILQEERYHGLYANGWIEVLAQAPGTRAELKNSLNRIWTETLAWFGPDDDPVFAAAVAERVVDANGVALRELFVDTVRTTVEPLAGMGFPERVTLPWDRWDATDRRLT